MRKKADITDIVTAGLPTVAVRIPAHPVAQELSRCSGPIAAPSANLSGKPSPTSGDMIIEDLYGKIDCIIDSGKSAFGIESSILDLTQDTLLILRPGPITVEELKKIFGEVKIFSGEIERAIAPGMRYRHYAPEKRLILVNPDQLVNYADNSKVLILCSEETRLKYFPYASNVFILGRLSKPYTIAQNLYKGLRYIDKTNVEYAVIESFPETGMLFSIMNRIKKASDRSL